jgi:hypothetical protein
VQGLAPQPTDHVHGWLRRGYAKSMDKHDQPQHDKRTQEAPDRGDDRRKQAVNPAQTPVPANPPVERDALESGLAKLDRVVAG